MDNKFIIVNYHYVEDPSPERRGIWPCAISEFKKQIEFLSSHYKIASIEEVFRAAKNDSEERMCAITFDDGLKDQYINAAPVLEKYSAKATFFPITSTFEGVMPGTHKLHILLSKFSADTLIDKFNAGEWGYKFGNISRDERINSSRRLFEDAPTANLKEKLLEHVTPPAKDHFLNTAFQSFGLDEEMLVRETFMSPEEIQDLKSRGFEIGSHTHGHYSLTTLSPAESARDIRTSVALLKKLGITPKIISYPHGRIGKNSNGDFTDVLREEGINYGVTIEQRALNKNDDPYLIPRLDTNDLATLKP